MPGFLTAAAAMLAATTFYQAGDTPLADQRRVPVDRGVLMFTQSGLEEGRDVPRRLPGAPRWICARTAQGGLACGVTAIVGPDRAWVASVNYRVFKRSAVVQVVIAGRR